MNNKLSYRVQIDELLTPPLDLEATETKINFHVEFSSLDGERVNFDTIKELRVGYRLLKADRSELLFEGRADYDKDLNIENHWIPSSLAVPTKYLSESHDVILQIDLLNGEKYWLYDVHDLKPHFFDLSFLRETRQNRSGKAAASVYSLNSPNPNNLQYLELNQNSDLEKKYIDQDMAQVRSERHETMSASMMDDKEGFNSRPIPTRRPSDLQSSQIPLRNALSHFFRMKISTLEAPPNIFLNHCYKALLNRSPEFRFEESDIDMSSVHSRIKYWSKIIHSEEFSRFRDVPLSEEAASRLVASLGWSPANTVLKYALRMESLRATSFDVFAERLVFYVQRNSYSADHIDEIFFASGSGSEITPFFEALLDLAAEFSVGIVRIDELTQRISQIEQISSNSKRNIEPRSSSVLANYGLDDRTLESSEPRLSPELGTNRANHRLKKLTP